MSTYINGIVMHGCLSLLSVYLFSYLFCMSTDSWTFIYILRVIMSYYFICAAAENVSALVPVSIRHILIGVSFLAFELRSSVSVPACECDCCLWKCCV